MFRVGIGVEDVFVGKTIILLFGRELGNLEILENIWYLEVRGMVIDVQIGEEIRWYA